jgi:hypothetical protein
MHRVVPFTCVESNTHSTSENRNIRIINVNKMLEQGILLAFDTLSFWTAFSVSLSIDTLFQ